MARKPFEPWTRVLGSWTRPLPSSASPRIGIPRRSAPPPVDRLSQAQISSSGSAAPTRSARCRTASVSTRCSESPARRSLTTRPRTSKSKTLSRPCAASSKSSRLRATAPATLSVASPASARGTGEPTRALGVRRGVRPAAVVDLVDGVEQQKLLHVGEALDLRGRERRLRRDLGGGPIGFDGRVADDQLGFRQLRKQAFYGRRDVPGWSLVARSHRFGDPRRCRVPLDELPDLQTGAPEAEVGARPHLEDDDLVVE